MNRYPSNPPSVMAGGLSVGTQCALLAICEPCYPQACSCGRERRMMITDDGSEHVELDETEALLYELHGLLLDQGFSQREAVKMLRGSEIPDGVRRDSPYIDSVDPAFWHWLAQ